MGKACAHLAVFPAKPDMNESTLTLFIPDERAIHPIDEVARFTHVPRHTIAIYCRWGLIAPAGDPDINGWFFNDDAIRTRACRPPGMPTSMAAPSTASHGASVRSQ